MQNIKINNTDDVIEVIDKMFMHFFNTSYYDLELIENKLYYTYDTSYHGSPHYQYKLITDDENKIKIFNSLITLRQNVLSTNNL